MSSIERDIKNINQHASDSVEGMREHAQEVAQTALSKAIFEAMKRGMTKEQIREILDLAGESSDTVN